MENLHVKFESSEALNSKKQLLYCEMSLINTLQKMQNFNSLRKEEAEKRKSMRIELKNLNEEVKKINELLPKVKLPEEEKENSEISKEEIKESKKNNFEEELREIKIKLSRLNQK